MSLIILIVVSCQNKHDGRISLALAFIDSGKIDSAMTLLNKTNRQELSKADNAMYSLIYTMAQDKSGIDVDNDSLIRIAYNWYIKNPTDTLYSKCMYYMGKCYALNDSSEKAISCFNTASLVAKKTNDNATLCLSLLQLSVIHRNYNPQKAINYAKSAIYIYNNKVKDAKPSNKAYYLLNLAECISYGDGNIDSCISLAKEAVKFALQSKDSMAISDSYQDLASFYGINNNYHSALKASIIS